MGNKFMTLTFICTNVLTMIFLEGHVMVVLFSKAGREGRARVKLILSGKKDERYYLYY